MVVKYTFRLFKRHIRVLPDRVKVTVKRGYGAKYTFRLFKRQSPLSIMAAAKVCFEFS
jgi:hypothetical protein